MTQNTAKLFVLLAGSAALALAGCSAPGKGAAASDASTAPATPTASASAPAVSQSPSLTPKDAQASLKGFIEGNSQSPNYPKLTENSAVPTAVRVAGHEGWDRVVVEYDSDADLEWFSFFGDEAIQDGSGRPLDIPGKRFLTLSISGVTYPEDPSQAADLSVPNLGGAKVVQGVHVEHAFEGMHQVHIGLDKDRPYRVQVLESPKRVVIDVANN
ncbi:hypothetical protein SC377_00235 [Actinotignum sp. SLA_B059]|uniref:AMIN-like domain-containing (lipo)protein n=1 Tax=Actinotignum sp. SLA_B059 TaxID=3083287 RepID=UPI002A8156BD|nr:hypothetical protein [Actinotignum sp. SLA_B059]MDY5126577.1 hypothetical protein [Actinotignum sp. SLA_B059]